MLNNKSKKGKPLPKDEQDFILTHCVKMTDEQLAQKLCRDIKTVRKWRKRLGIHKGNKGQVTEIGDLTDKRKTYLTEKERQDFFKAQLVNSLYYDNLKEQFTEDEIRFYLEEYGALSVQFDDIIATEKRQVDELIKAQIMANRMLRNIRVAENEIAKLIKEIEEFRNKHPNLNDDEVAQERDMQLMQLLRSMHGQSQAMSNDYQKNVALRNELLNELNARRKDRIDSIKERKTTFIGLIEEFRERQNREKHGRHLELVKISKEKKMNEWRKARKFPDGTTDCVLMDENSEIREKELVLIEDMKSEFVEKYSKTRGKSILVVDDEMRRLQFFQEVFKDNEVKFARTASDAYLKLEEFDNKVDLVCLDFDLSMGQKGSDFANLIINKGLCKKTDILIHSMNEEGAGKLTNMLKGERSIETIGFETIFDYWSKKCQE